MAVGANDHIDKMLVQRYAREQANNLEDAQTLSITSDRYWEIMKDVGQVHMAMIKVKNLAQKALEPNKMKASKNLAG